MAGGDRWYRINTPGPFGWSAVGIGNFAAPNSPSAALHVNTNLLTPSSAFNQGEVFRTDAPGGLSAHWRFLQGGTEIGQFFSPASSDNFVLQTTQMNGDMIFNTDATERLRITSFGSIQGDPSSVASAPRSFAYGLNLSVTG